MTEAPGFLLMVLAFLLVIGPLVFVHELGHYLAGRVFGVKAETFAIGFGQELAGFTDRRGTRWRFGWLPLGGYVRFAGDMNPASQPDPEWLALPPAERARTFQAKPLWQRAIIVAAGPAINFLAAILILTGFALAYGIAETPPVAERVIAGSAADGAGIHSGDRIVAMDGRDIATFDELARFVRLRPGETVGVEVLRGADRLSLSATIGADVQQDRFGNTYRFGQLGIERGAAVARPVGLLEAPMVAIDRCGDIVTMMVDTLVQVVTGRRSVKELGGPLSIARASGEQLALGLPEFLFLIALVSINLGFINLLPVPMLDGGHLLFYAIEAVRRRPVEPQVMEWAFRGGLAALLALMVLVTINDLGAFGVWRNLAGLIG